MKKKMMAAVLFCAMIIALSVPALGAVTLSSGAVSGVAQKSGEVGANGTDVKFESVMNDVTLSLRVQGIPYVVLNPYSLEISSNIAHSSAAVKDQVIGGDMTIISKTKVPVIIGVKNLKGTPSSQDVLLSSKTLEGDTKTTSKSLFLFLSVDTSLEEARKNELDDKNPLTGTVLITGSDKTKADLYKIPADTDGTDANKQEAHLTICGNAVKAPATSWASGDGVTVDFTLTARMAEAS